MTLLELIGRGGDLDHAIESPGREPLAYGEVRSQVERTVVTLATFGLGPGDRVAIVLPGGPELVTALLGVASAAAAAAPLNPAYRSEEFEHYLADLGASAVLTCEAAGQHVHAAASALGVPVVHVNVSDGAPAGAFELELLTRRHQPASIRPRPARAADTALLLHTSGTTSRPKLVPLAHAKLVASADSVARTLRLDGADRCLTVMPLFHIHGIVGAALATLGTGGSVLCTGFNAFRFLDWLREMRPTWTTAVPTMYQAVLARLRDRDQRAVGHTLAFLRSSSLALAPALMSRLEAAFDVPVIEALGMTEAAHQVASNPLPPDQRRPGSVGIAAGADVAVVGTGGVVRPSGSGELVVRGPAVFDGYENNPEANASAFVDGWFRTGDSVVIDEAGYVTIVGRIKELINRGGEKIGPREIEDVLLDHPAVEQAVAFPMPHPTLGDDVAAAVVLDTPTAATPAELREHVRRRLAAFKVPHSLLVVDEIPVGPTGKPQRLKLATLFGLTTAGD